MAQATEPKRKRRERGSIDPEVILTGAFELAEEVGVDNLSMPMLGKHLGVGVTSIYWYFRKKDDLLNAMTDQAVIRYDLGALLKPARGGWRNQIQKHAQQSRDVFRSNPILCDLLLIRSSLSPKYAQLGAIGIERLVKTLVDTGLSLDDAYDTYSAVQLHVRGSVVLERLYERSKAEDASSRTYYESLEVSEEKTPLLAEAAARGHIGGAPNDANFEFGLECILEHTAALIEKSKRTAKG